MVYRHRLFSQSWLTYQCQSLQWAYYCLRMVLFNSFKPFEVDNLDGLSCRTEYRQCIPSSPIPGHYLMGCAVQRCMFVYSMSIMSISQWLFSFQQKVEQLWLCAAPVSLGSSLVWVSGSMCLHRAEQVCRFSRPNRTPQIKKLFFCLQVYHSVLGQEPNMVIL